MGEVEIAQMGGQWGIPWYVDIAPARREDRVQIDCRGYCSFYAYPFLVGYTLPLPMLVVDFYRYYEVCPAHIFPYLYKLFFYVYQVCEASRKGGHPEARAHPLRSPEDLRHHDSCAPSWDEGLGGGNGRQNHHRFFENFFSIRTEHLVADPTGFPEAWNFVRKSFDWKNALF